MNINKIVTLTLLAGSLSLSANNCNARSHLSINYERPVLTDLRPIRLNTCPFMPDLVITYQSTNWNASAHQVRLTVKNIGSKSSGAFMLYVTPNENPVSNNHRPQRRYSINGLRPGEARSIKADFDALAHPANNMLGNVFEVTAYADPKNQVKECNDNNNTRTNSVP